MGARRTIALGFTKDDTLIYAEWEVTPPTDKVTTFTDHTVGPTPARVAISFVEIRTKTPRLRPTDHADRYWEGAGQISPEDRMIVRPLIPREQITAIETAWATSHLNDMNAACDHMTEDMLTPADDVLDEYIRTEIEKRGEWREKYSPAFYGRTDAIQKWRLDNVVCPETGYKYGHAWLTKAVDPAILESLASIKGAPQND